MGVVAVGSTADLTGVDLETFVERGHGVRDISHEFMFINVYQCKHRLFMFILYTYMRVLSNKILL